MTDSGFVYFDLPRAALARRWLSLGLLTGLALVIVYYAVAG